MEINYKQLLHKTVGQIKEMEEYRKKDDNNFWDMIDRQKETVASALEQENIKEPWAKKFLKEMEIE